MVGEQLELDFSAPLPSLPQLWTPDDIFNSADPAVIADFKEDNRVERKRSRISQKNLSEYASMWANTQPYGGIVFLGIENDGTITGCGSTEQSHINKLETVSRLCPDAKMEFKRVAVKNQTGKDDFVIVLRSYFREDKLVETTDGSAFVREGDQKRRLTEAEKREIRLNRGELDCESEPANLRFPEDFDLSLLNEYRSTYLKIRQLDHRYSIEDILKLSKLGKLSNKTFQPNLACALLFAKDSRSVVPGA